MDEIDNWYEIFSILSWNCNNGIATSKKIKPRCIPGLFATKRAYF